MWRTLVTVALVGSVCGLLAADVEPDDLIKDRKGYIPYRKHDPVKGKTLALLVSDVKGYMGYDGRGGPSDAMGLSFNNNSYRWIYVVSDAKNPLITNLNIEVGEKPGRTKTYPKLGMANPTEVRRWDITVPYSLVEVEVNDGEGAPPGEGFVATKMKRLDGTKAFPLDVTRTVEMLRKRYAADSKGIEKKVEAVLKAEETKALKGRKPTGPRTTEQLEYMTWLTEKNTMRMAFRTVISDGAYTEVEAGGGRGRPLPLPPGPRKKGVVALFPPPPPPPFKVKVGTTIRVEFGFAYEVDKDGKVTKRQALPPLGSAQELPMPPGVGGAAPALIGD